MTEKTVFLMDSNKIDYFDGRFLVTFDEHIEYLAKKQKKQKKQKRKQFFKKLLNYWLKRGKNHGKRRK